MLIRLAYRKNARSAAKAYTKKQFDAIVKPVLDDLKAEATIELKSIGMCEYSFAGGETELNRVNDALRTLARGTSLGYTFADTSEEGPNSTFRVLENA